jgi:hypothetical protein
MTKFTETLREISCGEKSLYFGSEFNIKYHDVMEIFESTCRINISE